jgi:hypothetical protein
VSDLLPNARLLTLEGYGHTSLFQSACINRYVADYLVRTALPPEGATCQSDVVPFPEQPRAPSAMARPMPPQLQLLATRFAG